MNILQTDLRFVQYVHKTYNDLEVSIINRVLNNRDINATYINKTFNLSSAPRRLRL